ncbi:hypothetical protein [Kitasatospora sp. CB02891]|uniref:hypothetical protein n=1 Tax=Kitasatospora sp. CB02891 TaxID=2020329 RepID=UPI000C27B3AE|nr:hypothetical protein [Kitasatospora sp. CB02891]PJN21159.1 hypothetical protein CG736_35045 [Kitasatospora sp. CB02891]
MASNRRPEFEIGSTRGAKGDLDQLLGGGRAKKSTAAERKMNAYVDPEVQAAAKRAQHWTQLQPEGYRTFSDLVEEALKRVTKELEEKYNNGQPFEEIPGSEGDKLAGGRRLGT